uniref:Uncharacterized protein n=1 Tax=Monodelphis domestica TaxID=13616 RepID=A0A5F8HGR5_MONDO
MMICLLPSYKTIILLIEQLSIDCKDSISLLKIQDAVLTYERSLELKKGRCTLLAEKVKSLENKITGLQEELSETREVKSQLEHQKVEWDRELCSLRFTLKQEEEKRLNSEMLFKKISEQLRRKEKQYIKEVEIKEQLELTLRSLHLELKAVRNNLKQVEEERNETQRKLSHEQSARALQDGILSNHFWKQKEAFEANVSKMNQSCEVFILVIFNSNGMFLKAKIFVLQFSTYLLSSVLCLTTLTQQLEDASSKCIHLESMNRGLQEELFSLKTVQKKCDRLEKNKKQLEEEIANLKHHLEIYTLERSQVEQYKREIEERARQEIVEKLKEVNLFLQTQAASQENLEQLRENNNASIRNQMEHRIRDLESELSKLKNSQQDSTKAELEIYRQLYSEELKTRKSLSNKLERTNERLAEVSAELLNEKQRSKTLITSFTASPVLEPPHIGNLNNSLVLNRGLIPRGNIVYSTGNTVSSRNRAEAYFTKVSHLEFFFFLSVINIKYSFFKQLPSILESILHIGSMAEDW